MILKGTVLIITLLAIVAACHSIPNLYEPGKEYIYDYNAKINVGTFKPAIFASQFILDGKLHVQNIENSLFMRLSDLAFKLYNGELNQHDEYESIALPLPKEADDLLKPFQMHYENGKIKNFASDLHDHKFSTDMKKAIASLIQMDLAQIKLDAKIPYAFITSEDSIYGDVEARYNVMPDESEIIVQKMLNVQSSKHWLAYFGMTDNDHYDELADRNAVSIDSHREYKLLKGEHGFYINTIDAQGGIFSHMMKGFTDTQFMYVNQTLHLASQIPTSEKISLNEEKSIVNDISFKLEADESDETITNLSFGRSKMTMETLENLIDGILDEVIAHTKTDKLTNESPNLKQGQAINRLHRLMIMLDIPALEKIFLHLQEQSNTEKFNIFQEMVPLIGTRASIKFVRNLIRKQKIEDVIAISMLQKMPFHLQMPSGKLLTEVEDLMNLDNVHLNVHKAAVLSFATLVYKTYSHYMIQNNLVKQTIKEDLLEKYTLKYMELLKSSQDYSSQYLYINGLYNIRIGNVMKYLEPYVKGEATSNQHLRYLAMCASYNEAIKDPKHAFEVYWPIFADTTLTLELRIGAYLTLVSTKPSPEKLYDMYWILKRDPSSELYNFHYTVLESLVNTQDSTLQDHRTAEILNFMREPYRHVKTGNYMADYKDPKYGYAALNNMMMHSTNTSKSMFIDFETSMYNFKVMNYGLWLKIDGIDMSEFLNWSNKLNWKENIMAIFTKCKEQNKVHLEYALLHNDKIIQLNYIECKNYETLLQEISQYLKKPALSISYKLITQQIMPNDLGMPSVFGVFIPNLLNNQLMNVPVAEGAERQLHWKFQKSTHTKIDTTFYNPVVDIWQGTERIQANEIIGDMSYSFSTVEPGKIKFSIYNQNDDTRDKFAMKNYATAISYVYKDVNNILQQSNKNSEHVAKISRGKLYRKSSLIFEYDCPHTGLHFTIEVFDTKRHVSLKTILEYAQRSFKKHFKNYETMPHGYILLALQNAAHQMILSPECGTFGLLIRATPSKIYPVDRAELLFHHSSEKITEEKTLKMMKKLDIETSLTTHDKDNKMLNQWEIDAKLELNMDYDIENYNIYYTKMDTEEKMYKVCMRGTKEKLNNKIIAHHNITKGHTSTADKEMCNNEEKSIWIKMVAEQSDEQLNMIENNMEYDECMPKHMHDPLLNGLKVHYNKGFDCIQMKTSLRKLTIDIMKNSTENNLEYWAGMFYWYYSYEKINNVLDENTMKIIVEFPTIGDEISFKIMEKHMKHKFIEMPIYFLKHLGLHPPNYYYSKMFMKLNNMKMIDSCLIADHHIFNNHEELIKIIDDEWMRIVYTDPAHTNKNPIVVFVKQMKEQMALKIKMEEHILEIIPDMNNYKISLNGKPLTLTRNSYLEEKLFDIGMLDDKENTIIMNMFNYPLYINYDGENIEMHKKETDLSLMGACFMH